MLKISDLYPTKGSSDIKKSRLSKVASIWVPVVLWVALFYWVGGVLSLLVSPTANNVLNISSSLPNSMAGSVAQRHWFGEIIEQLETPASSLPNVQVVGVYAAEGNEKDNFAIVLLNGQSSPLLMGKELGNGWILSKVTSTGIEVKNSNGDIQTISIASAANPLQQPLDPADQSNIPNPIDSNNYPNGSSGNYPSSMSAGGILDAQVPPNYVEGNELKNGLGIGGASPSNRPSNLN